jgi:hypothetical protein
MSERRITRRRGEAIRIDGAATIRVNRRVTLIIDAASAARVERVDAKPPTDATVAESSPLRSGRVRERHGPPAEFEKGVGRPDHSGR